MTCSPTLYWDAHQAVGTLGTGTDAPTCLPSTSKKLRQTYS
ncbi:hypothetical protein [Gloeocapsopsis sp. IPPAS B-1203]|nr:hypothetical protein [Gloeocapsopsis sp. IPPAS B-1203]